MADEQFSLTGYKFFTWFEDNKDEIKVVVNAVASVAAFFATGADAKSAAIAGVVYVACKKILDLIDYFCKK
jgi:hypothetical protein